MNREKSLANMAFSEDLLIRAYDPAYDFLQRLWTQGIQEIVVFQTLNKVTKNFNRVCEKCTFLAKIYQTKFSKSNNFLLFSF